MSEWHQVFDKRREERGRYFVGEVRYDSTVLDLLSDLQLVSRLGHPGVLDWEWRFVWIDY
jgi:hypothetical protein